MVKRIILLGVNVVIVLVASVMAVHASEDNIAKKKINKCIALLESGEIGRIDIMQIPENELMTIAVSRAVLDGSCTNKYSALGPFIPSRVRNISKVLKTSTVKVIEDRMADLRWGVVFYGLHNERVLSLYLDGGGVRGYVDESNVLFNDNLYKWLNSNFSVQFKKLRGAL
jgi:hypothetical protein